MLYQLSYSIMNTPIQSFHLTLYDLLSSTDTDECAQSGNPCQENAECTDIEGGFMCQCLPGYRDVESTCFS